MAQEYYKSSFGHVLAELDIIDLLIKNQYVIAKHQFHQKGDFHGLYISDEDVEQAVQNPRGLPGWAISSQEFVKYNTLNDFETKRGAIADCVQESRKKGIELRLDRLAQFFGLERYDLDILLVCFAPELNSGYSKIFAYLQDDLTKKKPTVELVLNILCTAIQEKMDVLKRLRPGSPLIEHRLMVLEHDPALTSTPFISQFLHVDRSIVSYLLGDAVPGDDVMDSVRVVSPSRNLDSLILDQTMLSELGTFAYGEKGAPDSILYFYGPHGTGKKNTAEALCHAWGKALWVADVEGLDTLSVRDMGERVRKIRRDAWLYGACVFWDRTEDLFKDEKKRWLKEFMQCLAQGQGICFLSGTVFIEFISIVKECVFIPFEFTCPSYEQRLELWKRTIDSKEFGPDTDVANLSSAFLFSGGQIRDAVKTAKNLDLRNNQKNTITTGDLRTACLLQTGRGLSSLARRIKPAYSWDDIVISPDRLEQLKDIVNHARFRSFVMDTWGFGRKLSGGKGLNVLFAGPSGTGKTMSAEIMASDLGLHLYKIDLARVVSKYIGETEKNLGRIFEEAETSNAILFFDEADAIFGKRSDVHDAHDRYANIETSYLLQKMEEYEGITILATNFRRNMDDAFVRRIQYAVEFPLPEKHDRKEIWKKTWPHELPLAPDIDFDLLADRFEMSGGNIKNICVNAAFIAASNERTVTMNHLMRATRNEYRKMGKLMMGGEFSELRSV